MYRHNYRNDFIKKPDEEFETNAVELEGCDLAMEDCAACTITYPEDEVVEEPVKKTVTGKVVDCARLNVRKDPSATAPVLCMLNESTEVMVDEDASTEEFYKICTVTGVEGYCMKDFILISFSTK